MRKERKVIAIDRIQLNEGQLDWLPKNPRQWTQTDIDKTAASILEDPDFLEDRPLLVVPFGKEFVAFGGNLRHEGCKAAKKPTAPSMVYYPENEEDYATIKRRAMKDNGSFGSWDFDELANNWDDLPLTDWGVPAWPQNEEHQGEAPASSSSSSGSGSEGAGSPDDYGTEFNLPDGERAAFQQMSFTLADEQVAEVKEAIKQAKELEEFKTNINYGNENGNGNALALIIEQWLQQRTS